MKKFVTNFKYICLNIKIIKFLTTIELHMKKLNLLILVVLFVFPVCSYAQIEYDNGSIVSDPVEISIEIQENNTPMYITVDQTEFIKNKSDGFDPLALGVNQYRAIGTTYVSWQPSDIYEIIIYTDNINEVGLGSYMDPLWQVSTKVGQVSKRSGLRICQPLIQTYANALFVPFKVWVPRTAAAGQTTAPVNPDGTIDKIYIDPTNPETSPDLSFYYIPEKMAVDGRIGTYGSYKKVIASAFDATFPHRIEVTFGMDVTHRNIANNKMNGVCNHMRYEGHVVIDLVGN